MVSPGRVLITGGCGFIGSHLARHLLARGHSVVVLDDLSAGDPAQLPRDARLRLMTGSVTDARAVRAAVAGCETVFHLAGLVGMALVTRVPDATFRVTVEGSANVLAAARDRRIVLLSSSCLYGHATDGVCREDIAVTRDHVLEFDGGVPGYATGKWEMERMARSAPGEILVVRPFNVVGPGQTHRHGMVLPRFIRAARRGEPLVILGDGTQCRAFSYVEDFVAALARLAAMPARWDACDRVLNLGDPTPTVIFELAQMVLAVAESRSSITHIPYEQCYPRHRDVRWRVPDTTRAHDLLGPLSWTDLPTIIRASLAMEACA